MAVERLDFDSDAAAGIARADDRDLSLPPHSLQAEEAVLGSVLKSPSSIVRVSDFLRADDFYQPRHKHIYQAMLALTAESQPIDYHTVADELQRLGLYEASGGLLYLSELNVATPTAAHIDYYGHVVERTSIMRRLISASQTIAEMAYRDNLDPDTALEKSEQLILSIAERRVTRDFRSLEDVLHDYMEQVEALTDGEGARYGIGTGYTDLDKLLGGFQRTDLIILAARTSVGKTSFALNLAVNAAVKAKATVAVFSLEMAAEQLASRLLSMESGVDSPRIRSGQLNDQETRKLDHALNFLVQAPIWVDDTASIPIMELRSKARRLAAEHGLDMIIVDYLQLIVAEHGENRVQELGQISRALKALARELRVPIIALSQLSRAVEQRSPHIPQLSDLRESGCLTGDTPVYLPDLGVYRPIQDLVGCSGFRVLSLNTATWKLEPREILSAFRTGRKAVYRLHTRLGRQVRATANHKFLTIDGWRRLDELVPGMRLALPRVPPSSADTISAHFTERVANADGDLLPRGVWRPLAVPATRRASVTSRQMQASLEADYCDATLSTSNLGRHREVCPVLVRTRLTPTLSQRERESGVNTLSLSFWERPAEGRVRASQITTKFGDTSDRAMRVATAVRSDELAKLARSDVYWDDIVRIEPDGEDDVFDLTVQGLHNFVAGDIVVHNSIEQDADVVLFIYRDEKYNPDTDKKGVADIIVAKHRNGPTGQVQLLFLERTTKFLDLEVFRA